MTLKKEDPSGGWGTVDWIKTTLLRPTADRGVMEADFAGNTHADAHLDGYPRWTNFRTRLSEWFWVWSAPQGGIGQPYLMQLNFGCLGPKEHVVSRGTVPECHTRHALTAGLGQCACELCPPLSRTFGTNQLSRSGQLPDVIWVPWIHAGRASLSRMPLPRVLWGGPQLHLPVVLRGRRAARPRIVLQE